jgi:DinB superfamily
MKKLISLLAIFVLCSFTARFTKTISTEERESAIKYLTETKKDFIKATKGLSEAQLKFRAAPDKWSIADCMEHIAIAETKVFKIATSTLDKPADPAKRSEIKVTDDQIIAKMTDRNEKFQAPEFLKPTSSFASTVDAAKSFADQRDKLVEFIKTTQDDLRNHFSSHPLFGTIDSYQMILLIAAHGKRHTLQIEEVKTSPDFPKK